MADSWRLKLDRAEKHLKEFEVKVGDYIKRYPYVPERIKCNKKHHCWRYVLRVTEQPDPELAIALGDVIHNMRSALDHLATALVPTRRRYSASFPIILDNIEDAALPTPYDLKSRAAFDTAVTGMPAKAIAIVKAFQPYRAGADRDPRFHALAILSRWENADKHRQLLVVSSGLDEGGITVIARNLRQEQGQQPGTFT
ncbi:MAG TPA: hypothetical protein VKU60_21220, partial [Chloroflexota bacterium]|nr:hypothetical protein [Chloroflexota bacterium]